MSKNEFKPKHHVQWISDTVKCGDFLSYAATRNLNPVWNRVSVHNEPYPKKNSGTSPTKEQGIIDAIFKGLYLGEVCFVQVGDDIREMVNYNNQFETVEEEFAHDGGHRCRAIHDFLKGLYPTHNTSWIGESKYYSELTKSEKEWFDNYNLRVLTYLNATALFAGEQFLQQAKHTPLNHQEALNGCMTPISQLVRELSRYFHNAAEDRTHPLFEVITKKGKIYPTWLKFPPNRLTYDRIVARIAFLEWKNGVKSPCDDDELEAMYKAGLSIDEVEKLRNPITKCLNFVYNAARRIKADIERKITADEFIMLIRLYYTFKTDGKIEVKNWPAFADSFNTCWGKFHKNGDPYARETIDNNTTRHVLFKASLRKHADIEYWETSINWFNHLFQYEDLIVGGVLRRTAAQGPRTLSREDTRRKWMDQGRMDFASGKKLAFKDAEAAHIIAHSAGGSSFYNDFVVVHRDINREMGAMSVFEYIEAKGLKGLQIG